MKQPISPGFFNHPLPQKVITTTTTLAEISMGEYDSWTFDEWNNLVGDHIQGKDKANIHISFDKNRGYYGEIDCCILVQEIITRENAFYDHQVKEHQKLLMEREQALAEYYAKMAEYLGKKTK